MAEDCGLWQAAQVGDGLAEGGVIAEAQGHHRIPEGHAEADRFLSRLVRGVVGERSDERLGEVEDGGGDLVRQRHVLATEPSGGGCAQVRRGLDSALALQASSATPLCGDAQTRGGERARLKRAGRASTNNPG